MIRGVRSARYEVGLTRLRSLGVKKIASEFHRSADAKVILKRRMHKFYIENIQLRYRQIHEVHYCLLAVAATIA